MKVSGNGQRQFRFGLFEANLDTEELFRRDRKIHLENQPFQILTILLEHAGEMATREELQKRLWPSDTFVEFDKGLNTAVKKLRYALGDSADNPTFIETIPRRGYRFIAPVTNGDLGSATDTVNASDTSVLVGGLAEQGRDVSASGVEIGAIPGAHISAASRTRHHLLVTVVACALVLLAAFGIARWQWTRRTVGPEKTKRQTTRLTDSGNATHVAISPDGRYVVYALRAGGKQGLWLRQVATGSDLQILPAEAIGFEGMTFSPDGNYIYFVRDNNDDPGIRYLYVVPSLGGAPRLLIHDVDTPPSFSPDGHQFVFTRGVPARNETEIRIANADGTAERLLVTMRNGYAGYQQGPAWSPDGLTIAVALWRFNPSRYILYAISVGDGSAHEIYSSPNAIGRPLWLPDGSAFLLMLHDQAERGQLWTVSFPKGAATPLSIDLAHYSWTIDATRDRQTVAAISSTVVSNIWVSSANRLAEARPITSGELSVDYLTGLPNGKILARSQNGKLWVLNSDGTERRLFTDLSYAIDPPTSCGRFVIFGIQDRDGYELMRMDSDGTNSTKLVPVDPGALPACPPDGKYVFYHSFGPPQKIWRLALEGGSPVEVSQILGDDIAGSLTISPDGKFLAYPFENYGPAPTVKMAVISVEGGALLRVLQVPGAVFNQNALSWSANGKALQYLLTRNGASNLWEQPLEGGKPKQLTNFADGQIFGFTWSLDRKRLLLTRGSTTSDVVLMSNFR
jgi:Tol biopolymer transport system component/DNA-binding winged helix-turn-helix (wHTH) protein